MRLYIRHGHNFISKVHVFLRPSVIYDKPRNQQVVVNGTFLMFAIVILTLKIYRLPAQPEIANLWLTLRS